MPLPLEEENFLIILYLNDENGQKSVNSRKWSEQSFANFLLN
jgi:hypothetical protein